MVQMSSPPRTAVWQKQLPLPCAKRDDIPSQSTHTHTAAGNVLPALLRQAGVLRYSEAMAAVVDEGQDLGGDPKAALLRAAAVEAGERHAAQGRSMLAGHCMSRRGVGCGAVPGHGRHCCPATIRHVALPLPPLAQASASAKRRGAPSTPTSSASACCTRRTRGPSTSSSRSTWQRARWRTSRPRWRWGCQSQELAHGQRASPPAWNEGSPFAS